MIPPPHGARRPVTVVSAWEPELAPLREALDAAGVASLRLREVGVGLVDAAARAARLMADERPEAVVFMGTCGALPGSGLAVLDVVCGARTRLACAAGDGVALFGALAEDELGDADLLARASAAGARPVTVLTTLGVTTRDDLARTLASRGEVEHLEAHAVARAARLAGVPFACVLAVANPVGMGGREAFRANHHEASARAAQIVARAYAGIT